MNELNIPGKIPRQIRKWICHKLECFTDYIKARAKTLRNTNCCYLELYAGCGSCVCKGTDCCIEDSELRALKAKTKFTKYIFVVRNHQNAENLKRLTTPCNTNNIDSMSNAISLNYHFFIFTYRMSTDVISRGNQ